MDDVIIISHRLNSERIQSEPKMTRLGNYRELPTSKPRRQNELQVLVNELVAVQRGMKSNPRSNIKLDARSTITTRLEFVLN